MMVDQAAIARAAVLIQRRPRLALVLIAVYEMIENRKQCRVSIDVRDGAIRILRESVEMTFPLSDPPAPPMGG